MGLDMNLIRRISFGDKCSITENGRLVRLNKGQSIFTEEDVCVWNRTEHIHNWIVTHCEQSDGTDNVFFEVYVSELKELLSECMRVFKDTTLAEDILPTYEGLFEYNQRYFDEIERTITALEDVIANYNSLTTFFYSASW